MTTESLMILGTGVALAAAILPGQYALRRDVAGLRERMARFEERMIRFEEHTARLEERVLRFEERMARFEGLFEGFTRRGKSRAKA